jgi:FSR family fosmidomycin resistance protein-like MFS transporter
MYMAMKDLDIVKAGLIVTIGSMVSNFLQPLFGIFADRFRKEWILFLGMFFGPLFMSLIGLTEKYYLLAIFVIIGNIMISLFHPAATDLSTVSTGGERSPLRFSFFSFVGTVAFAFTGIIFQSFSLKFGFHNSYMLAIPAIFAAFALKTALPPMPHVEKHAFFQDVKSALWKKRKAMLVLYFLVVIQSSLQIILVYSLPTLYRDWGFPKNVWAMPHLLFTSAGAVALIVAGLLAKKVSPGKLIIGSMALDIPLWYLFLYFGTKGNNLSFLWLILLGFSNFAAFPALVVLGQKKLPEFGATVSGILMGAA